MNQVVAVPYPGRGHINPILNLCNSLSSRLNQNQNHLHRTTTVFTVVVTEEWLQLLNPDLKQKHPNLRFVTIPNVIPSELHRGSDMIAFLTAVVTKMEVPFEELLDRMEIPVRLIVADGTMMWPFEVANRRNIPVAVYWPMSASLFSILHHVDLIQAHNHLYVDVSERGKECIDYIPGVSSFIVADLPMRLHNRILKNLTPDLSQLTKKADYVILSTIYELESEAIDVLKSRLQIPIYTSGPNIPFSQTNPNDNPRPIYLNWLDSKPEKSVLYISFGSYLSVTDSELEETVVGLEQSGVSFLWVARGETEKLKERCGGNGNVVEWCDQLAVLSHRSVGGFWTHCGWNSVKESLFSGVPMLTFPLIFDQRLNAMLVTRDWRVGRNVRMETGGFTRERIAEVVRGFMDRESVERIETMDRVEKVKIMCWDSVDDGGSAYEDIDAFVRDALTNEKK